YLGSMLAGTRVLRGAGRVAAFIASLAVLVMLPYCGWALLAPTAVAAVAAVVGWRSRHLEAAAIGSEGLAGPEHETADSPSNSRGETTGCAAPRLRRDRCGSRPMVRGVSCRRSGSARDAVQERPDARKIPVLFLGERHVSGILEDHQVGV